MKKIISFKTKYYKKWCMAGCNLFKRLNYYSKLIKTGLNA